VEELTEVKLEIDGINGTESSDRFPGGMAASFLPLAFSKN
jgi:hypothetical protein